MLFVLEQASINIDCPRCTCKVAVALSRFAVGAGAFCPACQVHISFVDDRGGTKAAERALNQFMGQLRNTIEINFKL